MLCKHLQSEKCRRKQQNWKPCFLDLSSAWKAAPTSISCPGSRDTDLQLSSWELRRGLSGAGMEIRVVIYRVLTLQGFLVSPDWALVWNRRETKFFIAFLCFLSDFNTSASGVWQLWQAVQAPCSTNKRSYVQDNTDFWKYLLPSLTQTLMTEDKVLTRYPTLRSHIYFKRK